MFLTTLLLLMLSHHMPMFLHSRLSCCLCSSHSQAKTSSTKSRLPKSHADVSTSTLGSPFSGKKIKAGTITIKYHKPLCANQSWFSSQSNQFYNYDLKLYKQNWHIWYITSKQNYLAGATHLSQSSPDLMLKPTKPAYIL